MQSLGAQNALLATTNGKPRRNGALTDSTTSNGDDEENKFKYVKCLYFGLNFIIFSVGVTLLALSIWVRSDSALWVYTKNLDIQRYYYATYFGMIAGSLLTIIPLAGCFGVVIESRLLLLTYSLVSGALMLAELALVVCALKPPLGDSLQASLAYEIQLHIEQLEFSANSRNFLDLIQLKLACCGGETFLDYKHRNFAIPQSCSSDVTNNINYRSCGEMLRRYLEIRAAIMAGLALILLVVQLIAIAVSALYVKFRSLIKYNI